MPQTPSPRRLTEAYVNKLACNGKPYFVRDTVVRGFLVGVNKNSKTYKLQADLWVGSRGRRCRVKTVTRTLAYNLALRLLDDPDALPDNSTKAVTWNSHPGRDRVLLPDPLPGWREEVQRLPSPLRWAMHELGLLTGLRPGTLVALRRGRVALEARGMSIPR